MNFRQFSLNSQILRGIDELGFVNPTPIQEQAVLPAIEGKDVLGLAQTGTGKTAAFVIPILQRLTIPSSKSGVRFLVLVPTRELAQQIYTAFLDLGKYMKIQCVTIYGGVSKFPQLSGIRKGAQIVVACPGRLLDHMEQGDIDLSNIDVLVLDEADTMCDMGFIPSIRRILNNLPDNRQTLLFSATMPTVIRSLVMKLLKNPVTVQIGAIAPARTVSHAIYPVPDKLKKNLIIALLNQTSTGQVLVFARTKYRARILAFDLAAKSFKVAALQGNMTQNARKQAMDGFRSGKINVLVATDIASHGIDVPEISHVINFDFPRTIDDYTHRIGRTGRADQTGEAFSLAGDSDGPIIRRVEKELGRTIERRRLLGFDYGSFIPETQFTDQPIRKSDSRRRSQVKTRNGSQERTDPTSVSGSTGSTKKATSQVRRQGSVRVGSSKRNRQVVDGKAVRVYRSRRSRKSSSNSRNRIS